MYTVEKQSHSTLWTTMLGTVGNLIGNFFLIRAFGVQGAALSTALSYALVFVLRSFHTRRWVRLKWDMPRFLSSAVLITVQSILMVREVKGWIVWQILLFLLLLIINFRPLVRSVYRILGRKKQKGV